MRRYAKNGAPERAQFLSVCGVLVDGVTQCGVLFGVVGESCLTPGQRDMSPYPTPRRDTSTVTAHLCFNPVMLSAVKSTILFIIKILVSIQLGSCAANKL